jgi:valyl-tRNA synthetase
VYFEDGAQDAIEGERWIVARSEQEALEEAQQKYPGHKIRLERDQDCLE